MKVKKSLFSIILSFLILAINFTPLKVLAADKDYSQVVKRVQQLGILDSGLKDYNSEITREQFLKAIIEVSNLKEQAATFKGSTIYPDVESNSDFSGYVNIAKDKGLMFGMVDGYFHPELGVTYAEACTILVKLLGYKDADLSGVWPNNYISKAYDLKLTEDLNFRKKDRLTIWAAAVLFDRLLDTNVKKANATEGDKSFAEANNLFKDIMVLEDASTSQSINTNEIITDKGTFLLSDPTLKLQIGSTYRVKLEEDKILKNYGKVRKVENVVVDSIIDNTVYYNILNITLKLQLSPDVQYFYHGVKQSYSSLSSIIKPYMNIVFTLKSDGKGYDYAVITDPVYSKPEVVLNFDYKKDKIGKIVLDPAVSIIRNGEKISKEELEELDVVYEITDVNNTNRIIVVYNNRAEGIIKGFSPNAISPSAVQIDNSSYSFSKDMELNKVSQFKIGDKVAAILGYDGKVISLNSIKYKTSVQQEVKVLANFKTLEGLSQNQIITDMGKYSILDSYDKFEIGGKYKIAIDGDIIVKSKRLKNFIENYSVKNISGSTITYENGMTKQLPQLPSYYYNGAKVDYNTALASIQICSSIILAKDYKGYDYGIILDPLYSNPIIYDYSNIDEINNLNKDNCLFVYRAGIYYSAIDVLGYKDVVYKVSDLWDKNSYLYINNSKTTGKIVSILPNNITPKTIQIEVGSGNTKNTYTYTLSKYFDINKLKTNSFNVGSTFTLILSIDGKVLDIY